MIKKFKDPTKKELILFAFVISSFIFIVFCIIPFFFFKSINYWPLLIILNILLAIIFYPKFLKIFYKLWMLIGFILGYLNTRILLFIIFIFIFFIYNIILTILRIDPMKRKYSKKLSTYREHRKKDYSLDIENLKRMF